MVFSVNSYNQRNLPITVVIWVCNRRSPTTNDSLHLCTFVRNQETIFLKLCKNFIVNLPLLGITVQRLSKQPLARNKLMQNDCLFVRRTKLNRYDSSSHCLLMHKVLCMLMHKVACSLFFHGTVIEGSFWTTHKLVMCVNPIVHQWPGLNVKKYPRS